MQFPVNFKNEVTRLIFFLSGIYLVYTIFLLFSGYFEIGLLSDDYTNFISAQSSNLKQKFGSYIPYYNNLHMRPVWFLSIDFSIWISELLNYTKEDYVLFRIENLLFFFVLITLASYLFFRITGKFYYALVFALFCLLYPNVVNDICWTVGRVDLLCGIFLFASMIFAFRQIDGMQKYNEYVSCAFFFIALFTKETAIVLPFILAMFIYMAYGKDKVFEAKRMLGLMLLVLIIYFFYRVYILGVQPMEVVTKFQKPGFGSSIAVTFKALLSLLVPFDYLSIQDNVSTRNYLFFAYMGVMILFLVSVLFVFIRTNNIKYIFLLGLVFIISIAPNLIAGYFRPQLVLIPFVVTILALFITATKVKVNIRYFQIITLLLLLFWGKLSSNLILDWKYAYEKSVAAIRELTQLPLDNGQRNIILGLPSRFRQAYMLDYASGPYNIWKDNGYEMKDKIEDLVLTGSLDANSLNAELAISKVSENEYELAATGETQYFMRLDAAPMNKYKDRDIEIRFSEKNSFRKPTISRVKILSDSVNVYVYSQDHFTRLFKTPVETE